MEVFANIDIQTISFVALATFGTVSAINFFYKLNSQGNFLLSLLFAIVYGFIPADLGNIILNRVRDAYIVAVSLNGAYQFLGGVAKKIGQ